MNLFCKRMKRKFVRDGDKFVTFIEEKQKIWIPKIIHQIWIQEEDICEDFWEYQETWFPYTQRGWSYKLWHNDEIVKLLQEEHPHIVDCYHRARSHSSRSNFARYAILYRYGGVYVDTDMKSLKDITPLLEEADLVLSRERNVLLATCIIGAIPRHPLFAMCLNHYLHHPYDPDQMSPFGSGPYYFTSRVAEYLEKHGTENVKLYEPGFFLPISSENRHRRLQEISNECYTVHKWSNTWCKNVVVISEAGWILIILYSLIILILGYQLYLRSSKT